MKTSNDILLYLESNGIALNSDNQMKANQEMQLPLIVKILSVFGGVMTMSFVLALYVLFKLYHNDVVTLICGGFFVLGGVLISKHKRSLLFNSFGITMFASGIFWIIFGMYNTQITDESIFPIIALISLFSWLFSGSYLLKTLSYMTLAGALIASNFTDLKIPIQVLIYIYSALFFTTTFFEHTLLSKKYKLYTLFYSLRSGSLFVLVSLLTLLSFNSDTFSIEQSWISSIPFVVVLFYLAKDLCVRFKIVSPKFIFIMVGIISLSTFMAPYLLGSITILLLGFNVNYRTGIGVGILSVIYSVSRYYYDLDLSLLEKSGVLFGTGLCFVLFYIIINKELQNEK